MHGGRIERFEPRAQRLGILRLRQHIRLGDDEAIGDRRLFHRLRMAVENRHAVDRIDQRDDSVETEAQHQIGMIDQRMQHGRGIGEARRLDDDAVEGLDPVIVEAAQQIFER